MVYRFTRAVSLTIRSSFYRSVSFVIKIESIYTSESLANTSSIFKQWALTRVKSCLAPAFRSPDPTHSSHLYRSPRALTFYIKQSLANPYSFNKLDSLAKTFSFYIKQSLNLAIKSSCRPETQEQECSAGDSAYPARMHDGAQKCPQPRTS